MILFDTVLIDFKNRDLAFMDWLYKQLLILRFPISFWVRFVCAALATPALMSCDTFDFNGENIAPASSFPIVYVKRAVQVLAEPIDPVGYVAGGDLYWRDAASASAEEINLTRSQTGGTGDVSSPEVSYDGSKVVFSMRRPADNSWNIWVMDVSSKQLTQLTFNDAEVFDDLHPHFLVDGRIVFSSSRQIQNRVQQTADSIEPFSYLDPKGRHAASLLHVMNADGSPVNANGDLSKQISFHVGHDRDVAVLSNGKLMFNRWEASGRRNHFPIITMNPDGTGIETLYGAYSKGNSFLSPRELPNGNLIAIHSPVSGSHGGGALIEIDINQFGDLEDRLAFIQPGTVAQKQLSLNSINVDSGVSEYGRFLSPYPVFDNSNRVLVSWSASNKTEVDDLQLTETVNAAVVPVTKMIEGDPSYGVFIMNLDDRSMTPIVTAQSGVIAYDAIAIQARTAPTQIDDAFSGIGGTLITALESTDQGLVHVLSVYDTDYNNLLGPSMLVGSETIPQITAPIGDPRTMVADIAQIKDLSFYYADDRPARFVRVTTSVGVPAGVGQDVVGEAGSVMQKILGYSEVEPDGSVLVKVPADRPIAISVLDANGRAITNHTSWFQVRPGEKLECAGCHSPRRRVALNVFPIAFNTPVVQLGPAMINETMAETRARVADNLDINNPIDLNSDIFFTDIWVTNYVLGQSQAGRPLGPFVLPTPVDADIDIDYAALTTPAPVDGVINFVDHIQPILSNAANAGPNCIDCHNGGQQPDLRSIADTDGILLSYKNLVKGLADLDPVNPIVNLKDGAYLTQRLLPYVMAGGPRDSSRSSFLGEVLFNQELRVARTLGVTNHLVFLNDSERRLIVEWMDIGANYYNTPFIDNNPADGNLDLAEIIGVAPGADFNEFKTTIKPILNNRCASCHKAIGNKSDYNQRIVTTVITNPASSESSAPQFVLTGNDIGDYQAAMSFIEIPGTPATNSLITRPLSTNMVPEPVHPQISDGAGGFVPVLSVTDADYTTIVNWIQ